MAFAAGGLAAPGAQAVVGHALPLVQLRQERPDRRALGVTLGDLRRPHLRRRAVTVRLAAAQPPRRQAERPVGHAALREREGLHREQLPVDQVVAQPLVREALEQGIEGQRDRGYVEAHEERVPSVRAIRESPLHPIRRCAPAQSGRAALAHATPFDGAPSETRPPSPLASALRAARVGLAWFLPLHRLSLLDHPFDHSLRSSRGKQGKRAQGKGLRQRAPMFARRFVGVVPLRPAARIDTASPVKPPPRYTRAEPLGSTHALPSTGAPV